MIGGIMYSWVKYHEGERKKRDKSGESSPNDASPETPDAQVNKNCLYRFQDCGKKLAFLFMQKKVRSLYKKEEELM